MVMQDGGAVDVRPGPDPGRAAPEHGGAYLASGMCLALYAGALIAWTVHGIAGGDAGLGGFVEGLFNPGASPASQEVGPYEWAFAVAFLVIAALALAQRRIARPAALLSAFLLLAVSAREGVGLLDAAYRDRYGNDELGGWALATRGLGLLAALVILAMLFPATERRDGEAADRRAAGRAPEGLDARWRRLSRVCGVLFLVLGAARLGWVLRGLAAPEVDTGRFLRGVLDASEPGPLRLAVTPEFTTVGSVLVLLVLGVLAVRGRRDVRGALLVFAAVELYLTVRTVVWLTVTDFFNRSFETTEGTLSAVTTAYSLAAMTSVVLLATGRGFVPYGSPRPEPLRTALDGRYGGR
ncbi:hypothetical protein QOM21_14855 [Streptomyces sp. Pv4-95]|uniref:hypothetical protein n=1 Tax=Streptomyces sp. Pv4-95 TaxID=3049543 RepID=UPI003892B6C7